MTEEELWKPITKQEAIDFIGLGMKRMKDIELENQWDRSVNEDPPSHFLLRLYCFAAKEYGLPRNNEFYECRNLIPTKIKDYLDLKELIKYSKYDEEHLCKKLDNKDKFNFIYDTAYEWWINTINELFD